MTRAMDSSQPPQCAKTLELPKHVLPWLPFLHASEPLDHFGIRKRSRQAASANTRQFFGGSALEFGLRFLGVPRGMVGHDNSRMTSQRRIRRQGLLLENV